MNKIKSNLAKWVIIVTYTVSKKMNDFNTIYLACIFFLLVSFSPRNNLKISHTKNEYGSIPAEALDYNKPFKLKLDTKPALTEAAKIRVECVLLIQLCTTQLVENGIKLNQTDNSDMIGLDVLVSNFTEKYGSGMENTIAIALGSNIDSDVIIDVNISLWNRLSRVEKVSTIFHEVCHDILNVKHVEGDVLNLMHPIAQPSNYSELQIMFDKFIRDYKLGRVERFSEGFYVHDRTKKIKPYIKKQ